MRSDMAKVIVERPRKGRMRKAQQKGYRRYLQRAGEAGLPVRECMLGRWNGGSKHFSEHLGPLRRYLHSQVGRPWSKVHSEICRHLRPDSVVQAHVLTHVWQYVTVNVVIAGGMPCYGESRRFGGRGVGVPLARGTLYVCPDTGLLKIARPPRRQPIVRRVLADDESLQYHLRDGVWHEVRLRKLPPDFEVCWDALLRKTIGKMRRAELWRTYRLPAYALSVRPLTKRETRALLEACRLQVARTAMLRRCGDIDDETATIRGSVSR